MSPTPIVLPAEAEVPAQVVCPLIGAHGAVLLRIDEALSAAEAPLGRLAGYLERQERRDEEARARQEEATRQALIARASAGRALWNSVAAALQSSIGRTAITALVLAALGWLGLRFGLVLPGEAWPRPDHDAATAAIEVDDAPAAASVGSKP